MRRNTLAALTVAAIGAITMPAVLAAQTPTPPRHERGAMAMRNGEMIDRIIEKRAELGLTDAQVTQLRDIGARLEEQNRPLIAQLEAARPDRAQATDEQRARMRERRAAMADSVRNMTPEQRAQMRERMQQRRAEGDSTQRPRMRMPAVPDELKPVMEQLQANTTAAMQQIRSTLTAEQQAKLRELHPGMRRQRESGDDRPARAGRQRARGAPAPHGAS